MPFHISCENFEFAFHDVHVFWRILMAEMRNKNSWQLQPCWVTWTLQSTVKHCRKKPQSFVSQSKYLGWLGNEGANIDFLHSLGDAFVCMCALDTHNVQTNTNKLCPQPKGSALPKYIWGLGLWQGLMLLIKPYKRGLSTMLIKAIQLIEMLLTSEAAVL